MKYLTTTLLLAIVFFYSCKKISKFTQFNVKFNNEAIIPANSILNFPIDILTPDITTNAEQTFQNNKTNSSLIESIKLDTIKLSVLSPNGSNFNFLKNISIYLSTDSLAEVLIASYTDVPDNITELYLNCENTELKSYVSSYNFKLRINATTDQLLNQDTKINIYSNFFVDAKIFGF